MVGALLVVALGSARGAQAQGSWWAPQYGEPLEASSVDERTRAATALGRDTAEGHAAAATARLTRALADERHPVVRSAIIESLGRLAHPDALDSLIEELVTSRAREAQRLLWSIAAVAAEGSPRAATVLVEQLDTRGRTDYARDALRRAGLAALPALLRALRDASEGRTQLAYAIGETRSHQATPGLLQALDGPWQASEGVALLDALAQVADSRSRSSVLAALARATDVRVQRAALRALETLGAGPGAELVTPLLDVPDGGLARQALATLLQVDPTVGAAALTSRVASSDPAIVQMAAELALAWRHPLVVPVLFGLVNEGTRADRALYALAELEQGAGVPVLLHVAREDPARSSAARAGLAITLRRQGDSLPRSQRRDALREVAREPGNRAWLLRALAGDPEVEAPLLDALQTAAPIARLQAAHALAVLGARGSAAVGPALFAAAQREPSAQVFRELAYAHAYAGAACPARVHGVRRRLRATATADAALLLLSGCHAQLTPTLRAEVDRESRRRLRSPSALGRATAAWSLARVGHPLATRTLLAHLESERDPWVRRAIARAVGVLAGPAHSDAARALARMEGDPMIRAWLNGTAERAPAARPFAVRGNDVLIVQLRPVDPVPEGLVVELRLPDGRALRLTSYPDGLLLLPDLAAGTADVEVVPTPSLSDG